MAFGSPGVYNLEPIRNWLQAYAYFTNRQRPKGSKWDERERPLGTNRAHHYRIVWGRDDVGEHYDLVLYTTPMVRYYRPDGERCVVLLRGVHTSLSWKFLAQHGWATWYRGVHTTTGEVVKVPLSGYNKDGLDIPGEWTARLVFKGAVLDTSASAHCRVYTRTSTKDDKETRALVKEKLHSLCTLMEYRLPTFHEHSVVSRRRGRPFGGGDHGGVNTTALTTEEPSEAAVDQLVAFAQSVYNTSLSKRAYYGAHTTDKNHPYFGASTTWGKTSGANLRPLDTEEFRKVLWSALLRHSMLGRKSGKKDLGQFPKDLPRKYVP